MTKKSGIPIVEQAIVLVPEFKNVVLKMEQQVVLRGQSKSTLNDYIRRIALFVIRFEKLPEQLDPTVERRLYVKRAFGVGSAYVEAKSWPLAGRLTGQAQLCNPCLCCCLNLNQRSATKGS